MRQLLVKKTLTFSVLLATITAGSSTGRDAAVMIGAPSLIAGFSITGESCCLIPALSFKCCTSCSIACMSFFGSRGEKSSSPSRFNSAFNKSEYSYMTAKTSVVSPIKSDGSSRNKLKISSKQCVAWLKALNPIMAEELFMVCTTLKSSFSSAAVNSLFFCPCIKILSKLASNSSDSI